MPIAFVWVQRGRASTPFVGAVLRPAHEAVVARVEADNRTLLRALGEPLEDAWQDVGDALGSDALGVGSAVR
jgi:hypothetical protein